MSPVMRDPERGDAEYVLAVTCDDHQPSVTVDYLGWWPTPPGALFFGNWRCAQGSIQTPFTEKAKAELRSGVSLGSLDLGGRQGTPRGMNHEYRFRFKCPECHLTVPASGGRFVPVLDKLRIAGMSRLSLQAISAML